MKKNFLAVFVLLLLAVIISCGSTGRTAGEPIDAAHNARNSLNWAGVYTGLIPAADGPGINVRFTLHDDGSYSVVYQYLDKGDELFESSGIFTWDDTGNIIILDSGDLPPYYKVGENIIIQLDMEGKAITGPLAKNYILNKE